MLGWFAPKPPSEAAPLEERPVLHLSGPRLRDYLQGLLVAAEDHGGVERYVAAIGLKARLFQDLLGEGRAARLREDDFNDLCAFVAPARRRVAAWRKEHPFEGMQAALAELLDGARDTSGADARLAAFRARFPQGREWRWVRDLGAEALHHVDPQRYPLMTRWVWDRAANTGVLREIWHGEDVDHITIDIPDGYATHVMLREELAQFLAENGVFRDMPFYVDLLCAHVYGAYVCAQGGSYLRADFSAPPDPMLYTRRMLGLDGIATEKGRTRLKLLDGEAWRVDDRKMLG